MSIMSNKGDSVTKRLQTELMTLMMSGDKGISAFPDGDNLFSWVATISGASSTVYEGVEFKLRINFCQQYPFTAPAVKFTSPCFHPNVDQAGNICLDILKEKWSASYDVRSLLLSIQSLLSEPNNSSPLNLQAADMWHDQARFRAQVLARCCSEASQHS